jgi:hypothetical protein
MKRVFKNLLVAAAVAGAIMFQREFVHAKDRVPTEPPAIVKSEKEVKRVKKLGKDITVECKANSEDGRVTYTYYIDGKKKTTSTDAQIKGEKIVGFDCFENKTFIVTKNEAVLTDGYGKAYLGSLDDSGDGRLRITSIRIYFNEKDRKSEDAFRAFINEKMAVIQLRDNRIVVYCDDSGTYEIDNKERNIDVKFFYDYALIVKKVKKGTNQILHIIKPGMDITYSVEGKKMFFDEMTEIEKEFLKKFLDKAFEKWEQKK